MTENEIARIVVDTAYQIHRKLGPGLLESVYSPRWIVFYEMHYFNGLITIFEKI